jgi:hypothetical protein
MSPEARERSFDELAVGLSSGTLSRGKAIKLMGAALVGGVLASIPGIAEAAPPLKEAGRKCRRNDQCETGLCLSSGVCSGFPGSSKARRSCPAGCAPVVLANGSIGCYSCPAAGCGGAIETRSSCADCAALGLECFPFGPPGGINAFACLPPCTAG